MQKHIFFSETRMWMAFIMGSAMTGRAGGPAGPGDVCPTEIHAPASASARSRTEQAR